MNKYELFDSYFEETLKNSVKEIPPDDIVKNVTPFRTSLNRVFTGLAFSALTLNFWALNYILPFIGAILSILGLRALRKENKWFVVCFVITCIRALRLFALLMVNSTVYSTYLNSFAVAVTLSDILLMLLFLLFLSKAVSTLQIKAGITPNTKRISVLILWYIFVCVLAFIEYTGFIIGWGMVIGYIFIIRSLYKLSEEAEETGYAVENSPVKISERVLASVLVFTVFLCCIGANLLFGRYEMNWTAQSTTQHTEVQQIKDQLISLGFPSHILEDMTSDEIKELEGAEKIITSSDDRPINSGRTVQRVYESSTGKTTVYQSTVYDVKELRTTGIAVRLPDKSEAWMLIHHFEWLVNPGFYGTESIQLWSQIDSINSKRNSGKVTGRVLYSKNGVSYTAPYHSLGDEKYTYSNVFFSNQFADNTLATFSLPHNAERQRGYLMYKIEDYKEDQIVDSWINYTHQQLPLQFPVRTAAETRMSNNLNESGVFRTIQDAIQF